jgi:excisionase family DNA binding protein
MENFGLFPIPFEKLAELFSSIVHQEFQKLNRPSQEVDLWFNLKELEDYLPEKLALPTLYAKLAKGEIPGYKKGKKWYFQKSEIDVWLKTGRRKTVAEIAGEADNYLQTKKPR